MTEKAAALTIVLVFLLPFYGFPVALAVSEFFDRRAAAWEWAKVIICVVCIWLIAAAMR